MVTQLTYLQAFNSMRAYLEIYYKQTRSEDLGLILSETEILSDGKTLDSAAWEDWIDGIHDIKGLQRPSRNGTLSEYFREFLTTTQAYNAMRRYLELYFERTHSSDLASILEDTQFMSNGKTIKPTALQDWLHSVEKTLKELDENEKYH